MPSEDVDTSIRVKKTVMSEFRSAVMRKHGTTWGKVTPEIEEALKFWARVLKGEVKVPK